MRVTRRLFRYGSLPLIGLAEQRFRPLALDDVAANLILPRARANRGLNRAHQGRNTDRTLEERDVSERSDGIGDADRISTRSRQHEHREIGPWRLPGEDLRQRRASVRGHHLLGNQDRCGAVRHRRDKIL